MIEETAPRTGPGADLADSSSNKECEERGQTRRSPCQRLASLPNRSQSGLLHRIASFHARPRQRVRTPRDATAW